MEVLEDGHLLLIILFLQILRQRRKMLGARVDHVFWTTQLHNVALAALHIDVIEFVVLLVTKLHLLGECELYARVLATDLSNTTTTLADDKAMEALLNQYILRALILLQIIFSLLCTQSNDIYNTRRHFGDLAHRLRNALTRAFDFDLIAVRFRVGNGDLHVVVVLHFVHHGAL